MSFNSFLSTDIKSESCQSYKKQTLLNKTYHLIDVVFFKGTSTVIKILVVWWWINLNLQSSILNMMFVHTLYNTWVRVRLFKKSNIMPCDSNVDDQFSLDTDVSGYKFSFGFGNGDITWAYHLSLLLWRKHDIFFYF